MCTTTEMSILLITKPCTLKMATCLEIGALSNCSYIKLIDCAKHE